MRENKSILYVFGSVFVLYIAIFLLVPLNRTESVWGVFGFTCIAFLLSTILTIYVSQKGISSKSRIYGFSLMKIGIVYTIVQIIFSIIVYIVSFFMQIPIWISLIISIMILILFLLGMITGDATRNVIEKMEDEVQIQINKMNSIKQIVKSMQCASDNPEIVKTFTKLKETIIYSDPVSISQTSVVEDQIENCLVELKEYSADTNEEEYYEKVKKLHGLICERNEICKLNKK